MNGSSVVPNTAFDFIHCKIIEPGLRWHTTRSLFAERHSAGMMLVVQNGDVVNPSLLVAVGCHGRCTCDHRSLDVCVAY